MKIQVSISFPSYSSNCSKLDKTQTENRILKIIQSNILTEKHKKSILKLKIDVLEFQCDFSHFSIMGASICCSNLGIEQKGLLTASSLVISNDNGRILVDPSFEEEAQSRCKFQVVSLVETEEVISFSQVGIFEDNDDDKIQGNEGRGLESLKFKEVVSILISVCKAYMGYIVKLV